VLAKRHVVAAAVRPLQSCGVWRGTDVIPRRFLRNRLDPSGQRAVTRRNRAKTASLAVSGRCFQHTNRIFTYLFYAIAAPFEPRAHARVVLRTAAVLCRRVRRRRLRGIEARTGRRPIVALVLVLTLLSSLCRSSGR